MGDTIILLCLIGLMISCNPHKKADEQQTDAKSEKECFQYRANKDTVSMSFDIVGNKVTGLLVYNLYEKDKSQGTIEGEMKGDTLIADYTFSAEGTTSISEVVFLRKKNQLVQGFGETMNSANKQIFKNRSALNFNDSIVLSSTECEKK